MKNKKETFLKNYSDVLDLFEDMQKNNNFKDFNNTIKMQDSHVLIFDSLYYLIENLDDIKTSREIIFSLLTFKDFLKLGRLVTLVYRALTLEVDLSQYTTSDFDKLIELNDRDILSQLAKSLYINDTVALKLIRENYQILKNLLENDVLSKNLKLSVFSYIKNLKEPKTLKDLLNIWNKNA